MDSQGNLKSFLKSELSDVTIVTKGLMPSYKGKLSSEEVEDVVSYLRSLKGPTQATVIRPYHLELLP